MSNMSYDKCQDVRGKILTEVRNEIQRLGVTPILAIIKCNNDFASKKYVENKVKTCNSVGIAVKVYDLKPEETNVFDIQRVIIECNHNCNATILQLPLAEHIQGFEDYLLSSIYPTHDIDGLTAKNKINLINNSKETLIPCTALAVYKIMEHELETNDFSGKKVCIVNRSDLIGKPLSSLLLNHNATVTVAHSRTDKDINNYLQHNKFDFVVTGIGKHIIYEGLIDRATIIDCGITRDSDGKLLRDVIRFEGECEPYLRNEYYASVGSVTCSCVAYNVLKAWKLQNVIQ